MNTQQADFLDSLFREKSQALFAYAVRHLGSQQAAEDVVMLTFSVAVKNVSKLMKSPNPDGWLMKTLKHKIKHELLSMSRQPVTVPLDNIQDFVSIDSPDSSPVISFLTADEEKLVQSFYGDRKSISEISKELHISEPACKKRLQRIRDKIKKYYDK